MRHATSGIRDRISRHTDTPSPSGSRTSSTATSGLSAGIGAGLADHADVRLGLQQVTDTAADNLVVVQEKHRDRRAGFVAWCGTARWICHRDS